jgi:hypothetical protein
MLPVKGKKHPRELQASIAPLRKLANSGIFVAFPIRVEFSALKNIILKDFKVSANISYCAINA